jgi:hypothetical protein
MSVQTTRKTQPNMMSMSIQQSLNENYRKSSMRAQESLEFINNLLNEYLETLKPASGSAVSATRTAVTAAAQYHLNQIAVILNEPAPAAPETPVDAANDPVNNDAPPVVAEAVPVGW